MTALSPSRYFQLARYLFQRLVAEHSSITSKRKSKALQTPTVALATASAEHASSSRQQAPPTFDNIGSSAEESSSTPGPSKYNFPPLRPDPDEPPERTEIYKLMNDERLAVPGAVKPPREVVVLCHGLYGFSTATPIPLFPSLKLHYWASVLEVLRDKMGANVLVVGVKGTGSIKERAEQMHAYLSSTLPKGTGVNFVAHSMGGLDARYLISNIKPDNYKPVSLTTIATPHRGSPFMDWCAANIGVGTPPAAAAATMAAASLATDAAKALPFSLKSPLLARTQEEAAKDVGRMVGFTTALTKYLLNIFDSPAYGNLTTSFLRDEFNPEVPDSSDVKYISVAGRLPKISVFHPLWFPKLVLDAAAEKGYAEDGGKSGKEYEGNDGLVSVSSAKWGDFLGVVDGTHHWDLRGEGGIWPNGAGIDNGKESQAASDKAKSNEEDRVESELMPGGWGWNEGYEEYLGLKDKVVDKIVPDALSNALSTSPSSSSSPSSSTTTKPSNPENNAKSKSDSSSWDVAQLGQVVEWVTDLIPGGKSSETSKAQIEEVKRESQDKSRARAKEKERQEKKAKEFDLARFYGGLMLKLREDGF